jgi:hypothetical protein
MLRTSWSLVVAQEFVPQKKEERDKTNCHSMEWSTFSSKCGDISIMFLIYNIYVMYPISYGKIKRIDIPIPPKPSSQLLRAISRRPSKKDNDNA